MDVMRAEAAGADRNPFAAVRSQMKLLAAGGHFYHARRMLAGLTPEFPAAEFSQETFSEALAMAILTHDPDLAVSLLRSRFGASYPITIGLSETVTREDAVHIQVRNGELRFEFSRATFTAPGLDMYLSRWAAITTLVDAFMTSPHRIDGRAAINLDDTGSVAGLVFSDYRPGFLPIPDSSFLEQDYYNGLRSDFRAAAVPWHDRAPLAFWRGATTGIIENGDWRTLPRYRLCEIGADNRDIIDAGITDLGQFIGPGAQRILAERDLLRARVPPVAYLAYRYQIDIDGNSNAWGGLFMRLLTGSPVLKVASKYGFEQWYYDRLVPWTNFVPVAADMSDLAEKARWLRDNDDAARRIGEAGRALAETLDEREVARAAPVIAAAMRADVDAPLIAVDFNAMNIGDIVGRAGSGGIGPVAAEPVGSVMLPSPLGFSDFVLMAEVSAEAGQAPVIAVVANGERIAQRSITGRLTVYGLLPRAAAIAGDSLGLTFLFERGTGPVFLHRAGVAALAPGSCAGFANATALVAHLNSGWIPTSAHEPGPPFGGDVGLELPSGTDPRAVQTAHGTILFWDAAAGRVRHGPIGAVPRNLFLARTNDVALLVHVGADAFRRIVSLRPEGPLAPQDTWVPWSGAGSARAFKIEPLDAEAFGLRAAGLLLCAEGNGEVTLSRELLREWECFRHERTPGDPAS